MKALGGKEAMKSSMSRRSKIGVGSGVVAGRGRGVARAEYASSREVEEDPAMEGVGGSEEVSESDIAVADRLPNR